MKYYIDCSINLYDGTAFGILFGKIDILSIPTIGDQISLSLPLNKTENSVFFNKSLKIVSIRHNIEPVDDCVSCLMMEDFVFLNIEEATEALKYLVNGFELFFECFDEAYYEKNKHWINNKPY